MTIKDEVLAAFAKLDPAADADWNKDGTPKLDAIRRAAGDEKIARDELTQSIGDLRRPAAPQAAEQAPPTAAAAEAAPQAPQAPPGPPAAEPAPAPAEDQVYIAQAEDQPVPEKAKVVETAKAALDALKGDAQTAAAEFEAAKAKLDAVTAERHKHQEVIESNKAQMSNAEAIKRVQKQTQANLVNNRARVIAATMALKEVGLAPTVPASALDAYYAGRKRTKEQAANAAAFHHQRAKERVAERLGTV